MTIKASPIINAKLRGCLIIGVVAALMCACTHNNYFKPSCTLPSGVDLEAALDHSRADLGRLECEPMFEGYFDRLLDVAKRDPDIENRRRFSEFLVWANDAGIIDKIQARNYYNRYFNTTFMSLPDDYNVCSSCTEVAKSNLERALQKELGQKEEGLLRICQDKQAYYAAADQYNSILLLMDATCTACLNK